MCHPLFSYVPVIDEVQEQLNSDLSSKRCKKLTTPAGTSFNIGVWYSGMPEQFLFHIKQVMHAVKQAGLVDTYYAARKKCEAAQKNWDRVVTLIIKYKKKYKEEAPFGDYEAV